MKHNRVLVSIFFDGIVISYDGEVFFVAYDVLKEAINESQYSWRDSVVNRCGDLFSLRRL